MAAWPPTACSLSAGALLGAGWLLWVDALATSAVSGWLSVPGILSTLGLVLLNVVSWEAVTGEYANPFQTDGASGVARCWVFCSLLLCFSGLITSIFLLVQQGAADATLVSCAWQNGLIFASALLFRAGRTATSDDG